MEVRECGWKNPSTCVEIGIFYLNHDLITQNIDNTKTVIEEGDEWAWRNQLKDYQGADFKLATRNFKAATNFFIELTPRQWLRDFRSLSPATQVAAFQGDEGLWDPRGQAPAIFATFCE